LKSPSAEFSHFSNFKYFPEYSGIYIQDFENEVSIYINIEEECVYEVEDKNHIIDVRNFNLIKRQPDAKQKL